MQKIVKSWGVVALISALLCPAFHVSGQAFNKAGWTILSEDNTIMDLTDTTFQGKPCFKLDGKSKAIAWKKGASLENFKIDADIAGTVMSGIGFHVANDQNYQFLYFRPGYGGTGEAIQYIPVYNGALSWVFYGAYQSMADLKRLEWFHATIQVLGNNLKVFTNNNKKPDMDITMLRTATKNGTILLRSMFGDSYFANIIIRELPQYINNWEISEQFPSGMTYDYSQKKKVNRWTKINEEGDDYINLCRYFENPVGTVLARHYIHADTGEAKVLKFDFTGKMDVWLNGKEIFHYDKYKLDRVADGTNSVLLNLKKGNNELIFITEGDSFVFGKGFKSMGRLQHQNWGFIASLGSMR